MLRALLASSIDDGPDDDRYAHAAAEHVRPVGGLIDHWIDGQQHEIHPRMEHDGAHPRERRPDGRPGRRVLSDGRVDDPLAAELAVKILHARAGVPRAPQPLSYNKDARIADEQLRVRFSNRLRIAKRPHRRTFSDCAAQTCLVMSSSSGYG